MADLLLKGVEFLRQKRAQVNSQLVSIDFGHYVAADVPARIGRSQDIRQDTSSGAVLVDEVRDFIITKEDYRHSGGPTEPVAGHVIIDSSSGEAIRYTIRATSSEEPSRWSDRYGRAWRIHTKRSPDV